jgi:hypothetical protein
LYHTVALLRSGAVVGWGAGLTTTGGTAQYGQLLQPPGLDAVAGIAAGGYHTLALEAPVPRVTVTSPNLAPFGNGQAESWSFDEEVAAGQLPAVLKVRARGDLGSEGKHLDVSIEGVLIGSALFGVGSGASPACNAIVSTANLAVPASVMANAAADGIIEVTVTPSAPHGRPDIRAVGAMGLRCKWS